MPLVLAMNDSSESGIEYDDIPYLSYEYPRTYRNQIVEGERFVYYRGRGRIGGGRQPQVYLGTGVIGAIRESRREGRFVCEIVDGRPFNQPLFFKDADGITLEPDGMKRGYFQRGVRRIDDAVYEDILDQAGADVSADQQRATGNRSQGLYADVKTARQVEEYSRQVVVEALTARFPGCVVTEMPVNNPGFDLKTNVDQFRYVEVKGTQADVPRFLISESERRFWTEHPREFALVVVFGIDLELRGNEGVVVVEGEPDDRVGLRPQQWFGLVLDGTAW